MYFTYHRRRSLFSHRPAKKTQKCYHHFDQECMTAPNHYLNQRWLHIIGSCVWQSHQQGREVESSDTSTGPTFLQNKGFILLGAGCIVLWVWRLISKGSRPFWRKTKLWDKYRSTQSEMSSIPKYSSVVAPDVLILITSWAASSENFIKILILPSECVKCFQHVGYTPTSE